MPMVAIYVHALVLWAAFFAVVASPPRSLMLRRAKQLAALDFTVLVVETWDMVPGA